MLARPGTPTATAAHIPGMPQKNKTYLSTPPGALDPIAEAVRTAEMRGYLEGITSAQAMTGFSDATFRSILDKDGHTRIDLDGRPL